MRKRVLAKRVRRLERRLDALAERHGEWVDVSGEPLDVHDLARTVSALHAYYAEDAEEWNPARGYL